MIPPGAEFDPRLRPKSLGLLIANEVERLATPEGRDARLSDKDARCVAEAAAAGAGAVSGLGPVGGGIIGWLGARLLLPLLRRIPEPVIIVLLLLAVNAIPVLLVVYHEAVGQAVRRDVAAAARILGLG